MPTSTSILPLQAIDYWVFAGFLLSLAVVGYVSGRGERTSSENYFLAGRNLPWYVVGGSFIAANISTEHFIGMVGASYILGISTALWDWLNAFTFTFLIFAFIPFLLSSRIVTIPEYLERRFSPAVRRIFAVITIIANIVIFMAAVLYAGGLALSGFLGWPLLTCIVLTGLFAGVWAIYGGLSSVAWTGVFTAVIKLGGVATLSMFGLLAVAGNGNLLDGFQEVLARNRGLTGPWHDALMRSVPHLTSAPTYDRMSVIQGPDHPMTPWTGLALLILSVGIWYNVLNQFIVQRVFGARNIWHARMGIVFAGFLKLVLPIVTVLPGLILFALHPEFMLGDWGDAQHAADAGFVTLVKELLPAGARGLLLAALFSAVQSTVTSVVNSTATVVTFDLWVPLFRNHATDKEKVTAGVIASSATVIAGILTAIWVSSHSTGIFQYVQTLNAFFAPPFAAVFLLGLFWRRTNASGAMWGIVGGFLVAVTIKFVGWSHPMPPWFYPFANQAGMVWLGALALCVLGTLLSAQANGARADQLSSLTLWDNAQILSQGLGTRWYNSVLLWSAVFFLLALWIMGYFSSFRALIS
ncbi:MAG TPA: sodium/solute symporter [Steroidobacteraceae bacterium]|nr:sodium/solute symporter [Steroidobacteraceae bacterium]